MRITVTLSPQSYMKSLALTYLRVHKAVPSYGLVVAVSYGIALAVASRVMTGNSKAGLVIGLISLAAYGILALRARQRVRVYMEKLGKCFEGDTTFETRDDGLHISNAFFHQHFSYRSFSEALIHKDQLLILTGDSAGFHLPITSENRAEVQAFYEDIRARLQAVDLPRAENPTPGTT